MKSRLLLFICVSFFLTNIEAQEGDFYMISGAQLTMPLSINKSYGVWTSKETKVKMSPTEISYRIKDKEKMLGVAAFYKNPKVTLGKADIVLLKAKNASLGITLQYYSYDAIPDYLSVPGNQMFDFWMLKLKANPKNLKKFQMASAEGFDAAIGESVFEGVAIGFYLWSQLNENGANRVLLYTVPKQNIKKSIMFFGETFNMDWDTGNLLDEGH